jgi:hypothetical protein
LDYLRGGEVDAMYKGISYCRFRKNGCTPPTNMGSCDLTDGVWIWPEGLAHYVEAHEVWLPDSFVEHALSQNKVQKLDTGFVAFDTETTKGLRPGEVVIIGGPTGASRLLKGLR